jgi:hypothetical protein
LLRSGFLFEFLDSPRFQIQRVRLVSLGDEQQALAIQSHLFDEYPLDIVLQARTKPFSEDGLSPELPAGGDIPRHDVSNRSFVVGNRVTDTFVNDGFDYGGRDSLGEHRHWQEQRSSQHPRSDFRDRAHFRPNGHVERPTLTETVVLEEPARVAARRRAEERGRYSVQPLGNATVHDRTAIQKTADMMRTAKSKRMPKIARSSSLSRRTMAMMPRTMPRRPTGRPTTP